MEILSASGYGGEMTLSDHTILRPGGTARLGSRTVARVGYGAMQLESSRVGEAEAAALLHAAVERGVDHVDTAEFYGDGRVNRLLRLALHPYDGLTVVTKVGAVRDSRGTLVAAQRPRELRAQVADNLRSLGIERLDVVNLRRLDAAPGIIAQGDQVVPLDDQLAALTSMRDEGLIGVLGLSNVDASQLARALPAEPVGVQNISSVLDRSADDVLALCRAHDVAWVPYFPLGSAFPSRPHVDDDPVVREVAEELATTPSQVALAWLLARYDATLLIPGTTSLEHLAENLAAGELVLTEQAVDRLDVLG
jgi:aryl-alcohol dehydrogenase-like predicted oxidoreductase